MRHWVFLHKCEDFISNLQNQGVGHVMSAEVDFLFYPATIVPATRHEALHNLSIRFICELGTPQVP